MQKPTAERTVHMQLGLLQEDLMRLRTRCAALPDPPDVTIALRQFKELDPAFEAVAAFTSILAVNAQGLDPERKERVEQQVTRLTVALWYLHLSTVETRLARMAANITHMPIGTRFVLQRWLKRLGELRQDQSVISALDPALLDRVESLSRRLAEETPDLMDFGRQ